MNDKLDDANIGKTAVQADGEGGLTIAVRMNASTSPIVRLKVDKLAATLASGALSVALGVLQIALGGDELSTAMLAGATFFGLLSVIEAGATTAIGILNLLLVGRFLFGAYFIKNLLEGTPISANMVEPADTAAVMFLGFAGVWLATYCVRRFARRLPFFMISDTADGLRALTILLLVAGTFSLLAILLAAKSDTITVGGAWGLAKELVSFRTAALPALMLYLWRTNSSRWLTHPLVLALALFLFLQGVLGSSKQGMVDPFALYAMMALARYGWRHPFAWLGIPAAILLYQFFISPIGQYARYEGGRDKDPRQAAIATADIVVGYLTNSSFRQRVLNAEDNIADLAQRQVRYLDEKYRAFSRITMVGEADRLVGATDRFGNSGLETVENSLLLAVPHFLYPNKPQSASGNFLGRYTDELSQADFGTQVSFGFMANAYNAYGMVGVLPLSFLSALIVLGFVSLSASGPFYTDPWSLLAISALHQSYVEASFTGQIGAIHQPIDAFLVLFATVLIVWVLGNARGRLIQDAGPTTLPS